MAQSAPARRSPSPVIAQLREQLSSASRRMSSVRAELKKADSPWVKIGFGGLTSMGGFTAGVAKHVLGDGLLGHGVNVGVGLGSLVLGANVSGGLGGSIAAFGAGMLAKESGDGGEMVAAMILGGE